MQVKLHVDKYQKYGTEPIDAVNISPLARFENIPNFYLFQSRYSTLPLVLWFTSALN